MSPSVPSNASPRESDPRFESSTIFVSGHLCLRKRLRGGWFSLMYTGSIWIFFKSSLCFLLRRGAVLARVGIPLFLLVLLAVQLMSAPLEGTEACAQAGAVFCKPDLCRRHREFQYRFRWHGFHNNTLEGPSNKKDLKLKQ